MRVLAGDIGGTKTLLQLTDVDASTGRSTVVAQERFESQRYDNLGPMAAGFIAHQEGPRVEAACFGVAGPVHSDGSKQTASLTNLPWVLDSDRLAEELDVQGVRLINDFQAIGYGIDGLEPDQLATLQTAEPTPRGPRVVLGAGTGLGVAQLFDCAGRYSVYATEAGHAGFAPANEEQIKLLQYLTAQYGRVSSERVLSGQGITSIYRFLAEQDHVDPLSLLEILDVEDTAAAVSTRALERQDPRAVRALEIFAAIYGSVAGDLALTTLATGGVYIAGGIAPKILYFMKSPQFIEAFNDKGRMSVLTSSMPVHVVLEPRVSLIGATLAAVRIAEQPH